MLPPSPSNSRQAYRRQHLQKGKAKRDSQRYYRKHRTRILMQTRKRYRQQRHQPSYRRQQKKYHQHPEHFHRVRGASGALTFEIPTGFRGEVTWVDLEGGVHYRSLGADPCSGVVGWERFLSQAVFEEELSIGEFFGLLDHALGVSLEETAVSNQMARARVR